MLRMGGRAPVFARLQTWGSGTPITNLRPIVFYRSNNNPIINLVACLQLSW